MRRGLREKRGQISFEYMMLFGILFAALVPTFIILMDHIQEVSHSKKLEAAMLDIQAGIESAKKLGPGSRIFIDYNLPGGIESLNVSDGMILAHSQVFNNTIGFPTLLNVSGVMSANEGAQGIMIEYFENNSMIINDAAIIFREKDCFQFNTENLTQNNGDDQFRDMAIYNKCETEAMTIVAVQVFWNSDDQINIFRLDNQNKWANGCGWGCFPTSRQDSGAVLEFGDRDETINPGDWVDLDYIDFDDDVYETNFSILFKFQDDSQISTGVITPWAQQPDMASCMVWNLTGIFLSSSDRQVNDILGNNTCDRYVVASGIDIEWDTFNSNLTYMRIDGGQKWDDNCGWNCLPAGEQTSPTQLTFGDRVFKWDAIDEDEVEFRFDTRVNGSTMNFTMYFLDGSFYSSPQFNP